MLSKSERQRSQRRDYRHHRTEVSIVSFLITLASSVAGIASGMFMIPYLQRFSMTMFRVIGTSTTGAAIYSVSAIIGYMSSGWSVTRLPEGAVGFVYVPAFVVMAPAIALAVPAWCASGAAYERPAVTSGFCFFLVGCRRCNFAPTALATGPDDPTVLRCLQRHLEARAR